MDANNEPWSAPAPCPADWLVHCRADRGEVDDDRDVLVVATGVSQHVFGNPDNGDAVEPLRVLDQDTLAFGQDCVIGGVPRDFEAVSDAGDDEVLTPDPFQCPSQASA